MVVVSVLEYLGNYCLHCLIFISKTRVLQKILFTPNDNDHLSPEILFLAHYANLLFLTLLGSSPHSWMRHSCKPRLLCLSRNILSIWSGP